MKIAMVCPFFLPVVGGMEKHVYNLSKELIKRGHQVTVFTSAIDHEGNKIPLKMERIDGIEIRRFTPLFRIGKFASLWSGVFNELKGFDIIHTHNLRHPHSEFSRLAGKIRGIPVVLTPHSPYHEGARTQFLDHFIKVFDNIYPYASFEKVIALHSEEKGWLMEKGVPSRKIVIIPNGVEDVFYETKKLAREKNQIIYVGRLHETKGIDVLIEAFYKYCKNADYKLVLVGNGEELYILKRLVESFGIEEKVIFAGEVPTQELIRQLDQSKIFVLPSKYEPFGISLVEAMTRGKACISTKYGGTKEIIRNGKNGLLVGFDCDELGKALIKLISNDALRKRLGTEAKISAQKYRWEGIAREIENEYEMLIPSNINHNDVFNPW